MNRRYVSILLVMSIMLGVVSPSYMAADILDETAYEETAIIDMEEELGEEVILEEPVAYNESGDEFYDEIIATDELIEETGILASGTEDEEEAAQIAANNVAAMIEALPYPDISTPENYWAVFNAREDANNARAAFDNLSTLAKGKVNSALLAKLNSYFIEDVTNALEKGDQYKQQALNLEAGIAHLPEIKDITADDEPEVASLEAQRDALDPPALYLVSSDALKKLQDARNAITNIHGNDALDEYINTDVLPKIDDGLYADEQKQEIQDLIDKAREDIERIANDDTLTQEEKEAAIQAIIDALKEAIGKVKTIHNLAAEAYEAKLKAYKTPDELILADKPDVEALRADYNNLSDEAKAQVNTEFIKDSETYIERLTSLEKKISDLETELASAKDAEKDRIGKGLKLTPPWDQNIGIQDEYNGVLGMVSSGNYDVDKEKELEAILKAAYDKIDAERDITKLRGYGDEAVAQVLTVRDKDRLQADAFEQKVDAMGPVIDLSRNRADDVKALRAEFDTLSAKAKKHVNVDMTPSGIDTYRERLDNLQARIDQMAQEDADAVADMIDKLPDPDSITPDDEGKINEARKEYDAMTKEAKAKMDPEKLRKLEAAEARLATEKEKVKLKKELQAYSDNKKATTTYDPDQLALVDAATEAGLKNIGNTKTTPDARAAKEAAIRAIDAVQTKAQRMKQAGVQYNFNRMKFRSTKQTKTSIYLRWSGVNGIDGFQIYGGKRNKPMKMLRQYDYKARSCRMTYLKEKTEYRYRIYAFKVVDGEIIHVYGSPVIYATTRGGKYGTVKKVAISKVGNKNTSNIKRTITIKLKKGKKAKVQKKEIITQNLKLKRRRKIKFESTNKNVATVTGSGFIKAKRRGTTYIRCYSQSGKYRTIKVVVK